MEFLVFLVCLDLIVALKNLKTRISGRNGSRQGNLTYFLFCG